MNVAPEISTMVPRRPDRGRRDAEAGLSGYTTVHWVSDGVGLGADRFVPIYCPLLFRLRDAYAREGRLTTI